MLGNLLSKECGWSIQECKTWDISDSKQRKSDVVRHKSYQENRRTIVIDITNKNQRKQLKKRTQLSNSIKEYRVALVTRRW